MKINLSNTWFLPWDFSEKSAKILEDFWKKVENLDFSNFDFKKIKKFIEKSDFKFLVFLWNKWEFDEAKAILESFYWKNFNNLKNKSSKKIPKIYFLDSLNSTEIKSVNSIISLKNTLFVVTDLKKNYLYDFFREKILLKDLELKKHFVFILPENSETLAEKSNFKIFVNNYFGKFSIFSILNFFILSFADFKIEKIIEKILETKEIFKEQSLIKNYFLNFSLFLEQNYDKKIAFVFYDTFFWNILQTYKNKLKFDFEVISLENFELENDKIFVFLEFEKSFNNLKISKKSSETFDKILKEQKQEIEGSLLLNQWKNISIKLEKFDENVIWEFLFFIENFKKCEQ